MLFYPLNVNQSFVSTLCTIIMHVIDSKVVLGRGTNQWLQIIQQNIEYIKKMKKIQKMHEFLTTHACYSSIYINIINFQHINNPKLLDLEFLTILEPNPNYQTITKFTTMQPQNKRNNHSVKQNEDSDKDGSGSGSGSQQSRKDRGRASQENDSFVVSDDQFEESYQDDDYSEGGSNESKSKKKSKKKKEKKSKKSKSKKHKKSRHRDDSQDSVNVDDLDVIEAGQEKLTRLKKNRDKKYNDNEDDFQEDFDEQQGYGYDYGAEGQRIEDLDSGFGGQDYEDDSEQSKYYRREQQADLNDLLDERVRKQFYAETTDKQIVELNLPQRQIQKYKNYSKISSQPLESIQKDFQSEDRSTQAKWIYQRLRLLGHFQMQDDKQIKNRIQQILYAMHRQHLDIMYIYYYRKKVWGDNINFNLSVLMKIEEIDQEWMVFKKQFKILKDDITLVFPSFQQIPRSLQDALAACTDIRQLKYFKDYTNFIIMKRKTEGQNKPSNKKSAIIRQICDKSIDLWLTQKQPFLSPHNFCLNIRNRMQDKKPTTPHNPPDKVLRKLLKEASTMDGDPLRQKQRQRQRQRERQRQRQRQRKGGKYQPTADEKQQQLEDKRRDWSAYPLLHPDKRITTLINYLAIQLFNYPEIRKILKQKYYKKLLISTSPTVQGAHIINIYNSFFPVKRIKDKPLVSFKKQMWILAKEAEKMGFIIIQFKFQWQLTSLMSNAEKKNFDGDPIYGQMVKNYFDLSSQWSSDSWNLLRKQVLIRMLCQYFFPAFLEEVKEDLTRQGTKQIIQLCCQRFRSQLNRAPSTKKEGQPIKILSMVLQNQKLGLAIVDEQGKQHTPLTIQLKTDDELKRFVSDQLLSKLIQDYSPDMILVSANCRRAQTLRKQLRNPNLFPQPVYCAFGQYEVPNLMANKNIIQGTNSQKCILEAISMARLKKNPMAEILGLWSDNVDQNGIYSMNLHPLQKFINKRKLIESLEKVAIQMVNLVGVNIDDIRNSQHCRNVLQFVAGLGPRKAFDLIQKVKQNYPPSRKHLLDLVKGTYVYVNCSPFIKFERPQHLEMMQKTKSSHHYQLSREQYKKQKKSKNKEHVDRSQINLLDMTRIPEQWYSLTQKLFLTAIRGSNMLQIKHKKSSQFLSDEQLAVKQMFKNPEKLRNVQWDKTDGNRYYDDQLVKSQIMNSFKDPRDAEKVMENRDIFYSLLKQTPQTLKRYMIVTVRVLNVNKQNLNVVIPENGLFGYIKLPLDKNNFSNPMTNKPLYEKGMFIKAVITGFPFDQRRQRDRQDNDQQQQLLKVDMALTFPHRSDDKNHDCQRQCFPSILKQIHPNIDIDRENFDLSKEVMPVVQVKQENVVRPKTEIKRISHPKFKNINMTTAIQQVKQLKVGDFIIRPSTEGPSFLTITWHFCKGIVSHVKLKVQQRPQSGAIQMFRVLDKAKDKVYSSIDQIIERYLRPMNNLVQDVISNKKFLPLTIQQIQEKIKVQASRQQSYIQYFFGCSEEFPQFFILFYMYRDKKPTKELIRVKNDGLYFHEQAFHSLRELISFFKQNLKDRKYQQFVKSNALKK